MRARRRRCNRASVQMLDPSTLKVPGSGTGVVRLVISSWYTFVSLIAKDEVFEWTGANSLSMVVAPLSVARRVSARCRGCVRVRVSLPSGPWCPP